jgi:formylglycine-generating enzyme required for sulfatase activity
MPSILCPHCRRSLRVASRLAGRTVRCPACKGSLTVPAHAVDAGPRLADAGPPRSEVLVAGETVKIRNPHFPFLRPPRSSDEIGWLGGYRLLRVLGQGGMGIVFDAVDQGLQRRVAVKVLRPEAGTHPTGRQRFLREARAAAGLHHDHVVTIHQVGEDNGVPFLVMPLLLGETLDRRLEREGRFPVGEAVRVAREMAEGLSAAHAANLIHRDVKPANVWLEEPNGRVKLLDFGLARTPAASDEPPGTILTREGGILGTPSYMAPEQVRGKVDQRADLFSLGCVLYEMATGRRAFDGDNPLAILACVSAVTPPAPAAVVPGLPAVLSELIMSLLTKRPEDRPAEALAVAQRLRGVEAAPGSLADTLPLVPLGPLPPPNQDQGKGPLATVAPSPGQAAATFRRSARKKAAPAPIPAAGGPVRVNSLGMKFVRVPPGSFLMGSPPDEAGRQDSETQHRVTLTKAYQIGVHPVTQAQWFQVLGDRPSHFPGDDRPVEQVSWSDCQAFLMELSQREGKLYRLPTEAEWEYACRAGSATPFSCGETIDTDQANFDDSYPDARNRIGLHRGQTTPVASFPANAWGLFDLHGNVWEWCADWFGPCASGAVTDPLGPGSGAMRVLRGGSWNEWAENCRSASRHSLGPDGSLPTIGLRVVLAASG